MGYLYIILSVLCRFASIRRLLSALSRNVMTPSLGLQSSRSISRLAEPHAFWIPLIGWITVWTKGLSKTEAHFEIVRIEYGLPDEESVDRHRRYLN